MVGENSASSYNINTCLFNYWTAYANLPKTAGGGKNLKPVLDGAVKCGRQGLCYSDKVGGAATFAVCYNQATLIPEFTGHILNTNTAGVGREKNFREDTTIGNYFTTKIDRQKYRQTDRQTVGCMGGWMDERMNG